MTVGQTVRGQLPDVGASLSDGAGLSNPATAIAHAVVPAAIVNVAITPPVYVVMRLAKPHGNRHRLSSY
jgi:hypothetical protein